jgi:hypothetical protein
MAVVVEPKVHVVVGEFMNWDPEIVTSVPP